MKPLVPCSGAALSPSGTFEALPATTVQQVLRQWFKQWGRPQQIQFDHGQPWRSGKSDLPSLFELWLIGLEVEVLWSRPRHPQDNGKVERSHRVTQAWSAPGDCRTLEQLQHHLDQVVQIHRQHYPDRHGLTRLARYPQLQQPGRAYDSAAEDHSWSLARVHAHLAQGCWRRKVDASGRISLYNRNYTLHRRLKGQTLWVRFDPTTSSWTCWDDKGKQVATCPSLEINAEGIRQLEVHRSAAKHTQPSTKADVAPLS